MVRTVEDASVLMGVISDVDMQGCDLNIATCLENRVREILLRMQKLSFYAYGHDTLDSSNLELEFSGNRSGIKMTLIWLP